MWRTEAQRDREDKKWTVAQRKCLQFLSITGRDHVNFQFEIIGIGRVFSVSHRSHQMTSNNSPAAKMLIIQFTSSDSDKCTECLIYLFFTSRRQSISIVHFGTPIAQSQLRFLIELKRHDETHICRQRSYFIIVFVSDFIRWAATRNTVHTHRCILTGHQ